MAVLKITNGLYTNDDAIENAVNYVLDKDKLYIYGGQGISMLNPIYSMNLVKNIYCNDNGKQTEHFILSFTEDEASRFIRPQACSIAYEICAFFQNLQVLFAYHKSQNNLHIHFIINTVYVDTGKKHTWTTPEMFKLKYYILNILQRYEVSDEVKLVLPNSEDYVI